MPDNLRITTPVNTSDSIGKLRQSKDLPQINRVDPSKVSSRNTTEQGEQKNTLDFTWDRRSVFQKFVERLQQTPGLSQTLQKLISANLEQMNSLEGTLPGQELLAKLMESIKMEKPQMLENLLFQQEHATKFTGTLFSVLRDLVKTTSSPELEVRLGRFLKAYDGYSSIPETMKTVLAELKEIMQYIPKSSRVPLEAQILRLQTLVTDDGLTENLSVIKDNLIPLLGKYIASSNDFGEIRDKITMLLHDVSRLNVSGREEVVTRFQELLDFCQYELNMPSSKLNIMQNAFVKNLFEPSTVQNSFIDSLVKMLVNHSQNGASATSQAMARDTVSSLLLDNSVYMPFNHMFLPVQYREAFLFSEIWVEKDSENDPSLDEAVQATKLYLSFDIKDLGAFDATIILHNNTNVDFQIHYPEGLHNKDYEIRQEISRIFTNNGFTPDSILAASGADANSPEPIMNKVYERRKSVDVTV